MNEQHAGPALASRADSHSAASHVCTSPAAPVAAGACEAEEPPSTEPPGARPHSAEPRSASRCSSALQAELGNLDSEPPSTPSAAAVTGQRHPFWNDVPDELWTDWRWQRQHAVRTTAELAELLPLPPEEIAALEGLETKYRTAIPPYYFSLINPADPDDPIRLQSVPSSREEVNVSGVELDDP